MQEIAALGSSRMMQMAIESLAPWSRDIQGVLGSGDLNNAVPCHALSRHGFSACR
jgi:hypothetical protein